MNDSSSKITQRDMANMLHVSKTTVSLALRDHPRISKELRRKAQLLASETGYQANPIFTALGQYRISKVNTLPRPTPTIAWLKVRSENECKELDSCLKGVGVSAEKFGFHLNELVLDSTTTEEQLKTVLEPQKIQGILVPTLPPNMRRLFNNFDWSRFAVVRVGRSLDGPPSHIVKSAEMQSGLLAFRKVMAKGHSRVGFIGLRSRERRFLAGILLAQTEIEATEIVPPLIISESDSEMEASVCNWTQENQPDAIITDMPGIPKILGFKDSRVPDDFGLVGLSLFTGKILGGIRQHSEEIGRIAFTTLVSQINDFSGERPPRIVHEVLVSGSWVNGPLCQKL